MSAAFRSGTTSKTASHGGSLTVAKPASLTAGDYWLIVIGFDTTGAGTETITVPSGWTGITTNIHGNANYPVVRAIGKFADSADVAGSGQVVQCSDTSNFGAVALSSAYTGVDSTTPYKLLGTLNPAGTSGTFDMPDGTVDNNGSVAVCAVIMSSTTAGTFTPVSGMTERLEDSQASGDTWDFTLDTQDVNAGSFAPGNLVCTQNQVAGSSVAITLVINGPGATLEQEGYRFRNDDGSETTATWAAAQDTDITLPAGTNSRLRGIINSTGDQASTQYQLEYKKSTDSVYRKVEPAGGGSLATGTAGTVSAGGTTSISVAYPAGISKGDVILMIVGNRPNANTPDDITGWDKYTSTGGAGSEGAGTGTVRVTVYIKKDADGRYEADGTETGSVTVACTSGTSMFGRMVKYSKTTGKAWAISTPVFGNDSSAGTAGSWTASSDPGITAGDFVICAAINSEDTARAASEAISATGVTFGTMTEIQDSGITTGNDLGMVIADFAVSSGTSSAAPVFTLTWSGTNSANSAGPCAFIRIRQIDQPIQLSPSSNITASGENTTAQLTAPSGKTTSDFVTGRMQDDENPTDLIDITVDDYTEVEFCYKVVSGIASNGDIYRFRLTANGTAFATYSVNPQVTVGAVYTGTSGLTHSSGSLSTSATFSPGTHTATSTLSHTSGSLTTSASFVSAVNTATSILSHSSGTLVTSAQGTTPLYTGASVLSHSSGSIVTGATFSPGIHTATSSLAHTSGLIQSNASFSAPLKTGVSVLTHSSGTLTGFGESIFPLVIANGRYFKTSKGAPFYLTGDACWSILVQLTNAQIIQYLDAIKAIGFNTIMFNVIEHHFSSQIPEYRDVLGNDPFTNMSDYSTPNAAYFNRFVFLVAECWKREIACIAFPAYNGFALGNEGWFTVTNAQSNTVLTNYGVYLQNLVMAYDNVIWAAGGDASGNNTQRDKQYWIFVGIISTKTNVHILGHNDPSQDSYDDWNGKIGWDVNACYPATSDQIYVEADVSYNRAGPIVAFNIEDRYENEPSPADSAANIRLQKWQSLLSGMCGRIMGNNPRWHFESPNTLYSYPGTWVTSLSSTETTEHQYFKQIVDGYNWQTLVPIQSGTTLVTSSKSSGVNRIVDAIDAGRTLAMVWARANFTASMAAFTGLSSVRVRSFNPTNGAYSTIAGSPFSPSGTQDFVSTSGGLLFIFDSGPVTYTANSTLTHTSGNLVTSGQFAAGTKTATSVLTHTSGAIQSTATYSAPIRTGVSPLIHSSGLLVTAAGFVAPVYNSVSILNHASGHIQSSAIYSSGVYLGVSNLTHGNKLIAAFAQFTPGTKTGTSVLTHSSGAIGSSAQFTPLAPSGGVQPFSGLFSTRV